MIDLVVLYTHVKLVSSLACPDTRTAVLFRLLILSMVFIVYRTRI